MVREYCAAHIRELFMQYSGTLSHIYTYVIGYVTGKKHLHIPWGKLIKEPLKWLKKRCYPKHFQWTDPSKIRIAETFKLIDHWRERISHGREPLIWVKTSTLFQDVQGGSRQARAIRLGGPVVQESSEENFDLPSSSDEEEDDEGPDEGSCSATDADPDTRDESGEDQDQGSSSASTAGSDAFDGANDPEAPDEPEVPSDSDGRPFGQSQGGHSDSMPSSEDNSQHPCEYCS